jgi:hypothetical protein
MHGRGSSVVKLRPSGLVTTCQRQVERQAHSMGMLLPWSA